MALQHIESLSRELRCSICLCVMSAPVGRLPCCHYFCMPCAQQSVQEHGRCPNCNLRVKRRAISEDPTMDRVVSAFAELEAHKEELLRYAGGGPADAAGTAGTAPAAAAAAAAAGAAEAGGAGGGSSALQEGGEAGPAPTRAGPSASFFETARESLGGAPSPAAATTDAGDGLQQGAAGCGEQSPDTAAAPGAGGICWLPGVDNEAYQSPSVSFAAPAQRRQAAQEARRLSLHSVQAQPADAQRLQEQEQAELGAAAAERAQHAAEAGQDGKENADGQALQPQRQVEPAASKQAGDGAAGGGGDGWQQRGPKTAAARRENAARHQRQAEGNQAITGFLGPRGRGKTGTAQQAAHEAEQEAKRNPEDQAAAPSVAGAASASAGGGEHAAAAAASPGHSSDLRGVLAEVHAMAAAAAAGPADSGRGDASSRAAAGAALLQRTPALAVQAAAPQTDKVPQSAVEAEACAGALPAEPAAKAEGEAPAPRGTGRGSAGRKRSAAGGGRAGGAGTAAERGGGGGAARGLSSGKRSRTAERGASAPRRRPTPAASEAGTPAAAALPAAALAASTGGAEGGGGSSRRIPTRLLPWNCFYCTFENQGAAHKCGVCEKKKKVLPASELTPAATAVPAAAAAPAAAEAARQPAADASPAPSAAAAGQQGGGEQQPESQAPQQKRRGAASSRQRKMSSGAAAAGAGAGGSSGKRRKVGTPAAPALPAAAAAQPSPAAALPARAGTPSGWRSGSGGGGWVLVGSSLSARGRRQLEELASAVGAKVAKDWSKAVTHVVCGCADGTAGRTFKYLMGVLSAKWVVREDWLAACLAQQGPADERGFLVERDHGGGAGGPAAAISSHQLGLPALLHGYEVFLAGDFSNGSEVSQLLAAAGARLLSRAPAAPPPRACAGPCTSFMLCEAAAGYGANPREPGHAQAPGGGGGGGGGGGAEQKAGGLAVPPAVAAAKWFQKAQEGGVPVVSHRWLLDSIGCYTPQPLAGYRLC